jgi:hypothetical protein
METHLFLFQLFLIPLFLPREHEVLLHSSAGKLATQVLQEYARLFFLKLNLQLD